ncbi:hypothetical protein D9M73_290200 [compost metagenome]
MVAAPGKVDELAVGGGADQQGVAVVELLQQVTEGLDLGRADEGEILGPEEQHLPLAEKAVLVDSLEGVFRAGGVFRVMVHRQHVEYRQLVSNGEHGRGAPEQREASG